MNREERIHPQGPRWSQRSTNTDSGVALFGRQVRSARPTGDGEMNRSIGTRVSLILFATIALSLTWAWPAPAAVLGWTPSGSMATARELHTATRLPDGRVLVAGGYGGGGSYLASAEIYDPASGTWATTGSMGHKRGSHTATLLPDGRVLVAGGYGPLVLASAEIYDPASGS